MNRSKLLRFLFVLSIVLTVIFGIELIVTDWKSNILAGIGRWCGLISQLVLAVLMFSEIKQEKNE